MRGQLVPVQRAPRQVGVGVLLIGQQSLRHVEQHQLQHFVHLGAPVGLAVRVGLLHGVP